MRSLDFRKGFKRTNIPLPSAPRARPSQPHMSDTAAALAHQLALVKAQLEKSTEESNTLRRQLATSELAVQNLRGLRELPAPAEVAATHDKPTSSAAGRELATPAADGLAAAFLPHTVNTDTKQTQVQGPAAPGLGRGLGSDPEGDRADRPHSTRNLLLRQHERAADEYYDPNAPLLFPQQNHASRKKKKSNPKGKHFIRDVRRSSFREPPTENMMKTLYPMFVLPVRVLLRLERLLPHQEMLEQGLLLPYNHLSMKGRVIFISHQCTSVFRHLLRCVFTHETGCSEMIMAQPTTPPPPQTPTPGARTITLPLQRPHT